MSNAKSMLTGCYYNERNGCGMWLCHNAFEFSDTTP
jgi:hypothetical protein